MNNSRDMVPKFQAENIWESFSIIQSKSDADKLKDMHRRNNLRWEKQGSKGNYNWMISFYCKQNKLTFKAIKITKCDREA